MKLLAPLLLLAACAGGEAATGFAEESLGAPVAEMTGLDPVRQLVELPDGRLLAISGRALVLLDLVDGLADTVGRNGEGPGEYEFISQPHLRDGRLWALDPMQQRLLSWELNGTPADVVTFPVVIAASPYAVDTMGHIYHEQPTTTGFVVTGQEIDTTRSKDSTWVYRFSPPDAKRDTVARLFEVGWEAVRFSGGVSRMRRDYVSADRWGVLPDGTLWIARGQENRVDRRAPDGSWTIGMPRAWTPVATVEADQRYLGQMPGLNRESDSIARPMAETKGPFIEAVAAPDGEVWTRMNQPAGYTQERYAIFPVSGPSTRTVAPGLGEDVVAISAEWVYTVTEDEVGLATLRKYAR